MTTNQTPEDKFEIIYEKCFLMEQAYNHVSPNLHRYFWCMPVVSVPVIPDNLNELNKDRLKSSRGTLCEVIFMGNNCKFLPDLPDKMIHEFIDWINNNKDLNIRIFH